MSKIKIHLFLRCIVLIVCRGFKQQVDEWMSIRHLSDNSSSSFAEFDAPLQQ